VTRVLFVDDEPFVLKAIDRVLRVRKAGWDARFVGSGEAALALLDHEPFDVIVSDLSMPAMDGVTLLGNVRQRYPHMVRLALSGQAASADSLRAVRVIHQWIAKPCDIGALCANIERLQWARELVGDPQLVAQTTALASLPSPPSVFLRVSEALARMAPLAELAAIIEADPAVVAKILQLVNSSFFGSPQRVTSIQRAAALVGTDMLRGLLLTAELFHGDAQASALASHSLLVAGIARAIAPPTHAVDAFMAGVLHDLGDLVVQLAAPSGRAAPTLHARAGGLLLGMWGLPAELVTAVAFHHDPDAAPAPQDPTLRALVVAEALAAELDGRAAAGPTTPCAPDPATRPDDPDGPLAALAPEALVAHREVAQRLWQDRLR
jgi:HD-like signal output (HDOD) protein/CheY-like chemotaxis protein